MYELSIIKQNGGAYIDSREVAEAIGKRHDHLLRDIAGYLKILTKSTAPNFGGCDFFLKSSYIDAKGRERLCYLISKMGCEVCGNKLSGEKGVLFTTYYVRKFNQMEAAERDAEIKANAKPRLSEFNSAVRNVLSGMSYCCVKPDRIMKFLRGVYEPLGIEVQPTEDTCGYFSASQIARQLGIYSETGNPHGHAVAAIISKLTNPARHTLVIPYGLVGVIVRYDRNIVNAVWSWIRENGYPGEVPHLGFRYHIYYYCQESLF